MKADAKNPVRELVTKKFEEFIILEELSIEKVAVVGGTQKDPEVNSILLLFPEAKFHYFNISNDFSDENFHYLDLNEELDSKLNNLNFDLVLSSQVIEHIWNHGNYFKVLAHLCSPSGIIGVNCPKSNMVHGSPEYFSAGFTARYLAKNLEVYGCEILLESELGNRRYYLGIHLGRYWQTLGENRHPLWEYSIKPGTILGNIRKFLRDLPVRILLTFVKAVDSPNADYATEAFVAARLRTQAPKGKL